MSKLIIGFVLGWLTMAGMLYAQGWQQQQNPRSTMDDIQNYQTQQQLQQYLQQEQLQQYTRPPC